MTLSLLPQNNSANKKDEQEGVEINIEDTTLHVLVPLKINSKLNRFLLGLPDRIQGHFLKTLDVISSYLEVIECHV